MTEAERNTVRVVAEGLRTLLKEPGNLSVGKSSAGNVADKDYLPNSLVVELINLNWSGWIERKPFSVMPPLEFIEADLKTGKY
jgi:hypothetical protein